MKIPVIQAGGGPGVSVESFARWLVPRLPFLSRLVLFAL